MPLGCRASGGEDLHFGLVPWGVLAGAGERVEWGCCTCSQPQGAVWPFLRTGDLGRLTPHGLELHGRINDEVKFGGAHPAPPAEKIQREAHQVPACANDPSRRY